MVNIRLMSILDYDDVYNLWINTKGMGLNNLDDSRNGIEKFLKRNPTSCFVAECENKIVGVIIAGHDGRRGYIYHTAVLSDYRNQGIGKKLVENVMEALEKEGIAKVALVVFSRNEIGNKFWKKIGFFERNDIVYRNKNINEFERIDT